MAQYQLTQRARRDLNTIWAFIAEDSPQAADKFVDRVVQTLKVLGANPYIGRDRSDMRQGYRSVPIGSYVVFYRLIGSHVYVEQILHGARDIKRIIKPVR